MLKAMGGRYKATQQHTQQVVVAVVFFCLMNCSVNNGECRGDAAKIIAIIITAKPVMIQVREVCVCVYIYIYIYIC